MRGIITLLAQLCALPLHAQTLREEAIAGVEVWGRRPMKSIGVEQTRFDSVVLHQQISMSVADLLSFNSTLFVKQYGRATLSTVSFRGTGASHTQVTWNGMKLNNPMLGMTDFSMIPSYFVDSAQLLHGTSAVNDTGGALGGVVRLATRPQERKGWSLNYIQGVGMYRTFDEFLNVGWGNDRWQTSTRVAVQSSENDFRYRNRDKKLNIYDEDRNIIGTYHPMERNRSGAFRDIHLLQEVYHRTRGGDRLGLNFWFTGSNRELPLITSDYADNTRFDNRQREETLRGVVSWEHLRRAWRMAARAGYLHTWLAYDYRRDPGNGILQTMTRSRSRINTLYAQAEGEYTPSDSWLFTATVSLYQHFVRSADKNIISVEGNRAVVGYDKGRVELSSALSAKWKPHERVGLATVMRAEMYGAEWAAVPALFADFLLSRRGNVVAKASLSRNHRFPTLNDLYFLPGGNPDLESESGFQYEAGLAFSTGRAESWTLSGSVSWYDQRVDDWIIWLPTTKGFFSPRNVGRVHAYGVEVKGDADVVLGGGVRLSVDGTFSWSPSINEGEPQSEADRSVGKQLPYEPEFSATVAARLSWRRWTLGYNWCHYSERYTMSSNESSLSGRLTPYYMSNLTLEKILSFRWADLSLKAAVNNLLNEEYVSVLSRPMPRMNCEFFIGIRPKW